MPRSQNKNVKKNNVGQPNTKTKIFPHRRTVHIKYRNTWIWKVKRNESGEYDHFESSIDDSNQLMQIYSNLGCKPIVTFHKSRRTFQNNLIRLDFDSVDELGIFLEVKFSMDKLEEVQKFLENLGLDINKADKRSNIDIYLEKNN